MSPSFWRIDRSYISHAAYDADTATLTVVFAATKRNPARVWNYFEVDAETADEFASSVSPGAMFANQIKNDYRQAECGAPTAVGALERALNDGFTTLAMSPRASFSTLVDVIGGGDEIEERLHTDDDCEGSHLYLLGPEIDTDRGAVRHLWHLNLASSMVVPPVPRLVGR